MGLVDENAVNSWDALRINLHIFESLDTQVLSLSTFGHLTAMHMSWLLDLAYQMHFIIVYV